MGQQTHQYNNSGEVRRIVYNAIGKPWHIKSIGTDAANNSSPGDSFFTYDGSRNLVKRHVTEQGSTKTIFQHGGVELIKELQNDGSSSTTIRRNLGNALVEVNGSSVTTRYVYTDHLGSVDVITDASGLIEQKLSFDAFGKRRQVFTSSNQPVALTMAAILNLTNRGFTGHLQVDHANVIHMGGRIYDAHIGRFLQADPFVQAPSNSQSHNRYSYVLNNPLSYTDPSGYFFSKLKQFVGVIIVAVASFYCAGTCTAGMWALIGGVSGAASAAVNGGNVLQGALIGAFTAGVAAGAGGGWQGFFANAAAGGFANRVTGGNFGRGFWSAGLSSAVGGRMNTGNATANVIVAGIAGGTISKVTGGKFANGAASAAFSAAVSEVRTHYERRYHVPIEANTTPEQRAEIEKNIEALNTEITEINRKGGFASEKAAAAWYHEKVHPLGITYDTEFGANIFKNELWNGENLVDKFFLGNVVTQHYSNQVQLSGSQYGSLRASSKWHTHGNSNVGHTIGADTDWADASSSRSAYVSRGPTYTGDGISLDVWRSGGATTICGVTCSF